MYHLLAATLVAMIGSSQVATPSKSADCTTAHKQARLVQATSADYPIVAEMEAVSGKAFIGVDLSDTGRVRNAYVAKSSGNPLLDHAAIAAARSSLYTPASDACIAVSGSYAIEIDFDV